MESSRKGPCADVKKAKILRKVLGSKDAKSVLKIRRAVTITIIWISTRFKRRCCR